MRTRRRNRRDSAKAPVRPAKAYYHPQMKEFLLMYDDVRNGASPREALLEFLQSTYEAAARPGEVGSQGPRESSNVGTRTNLTQK